MVRTSGPCRPSGRRSASRGSAGSGDGSAISRRISLATARASAVASWSSAPSSGSCTNSTSASDAYPISWPPRRPIPMTATRVTNGPRRSASMARTAASSAPARVASATAVKASHSLGRQQADEVGRRHAHQLATAHGPDHIGGRHGVVVPADTREHLGLERLTAPRHQLRIVAEHGDRVWCSHQELGRKPARGEHLGHPLRRGALIAQQPQVPRGLSECVADPAETGQPRIRLRGIGKPAQHDRQQRPLDGRAAADPAGGASMWRRAPAGSA